jgi:hypothetical protein
MWNFFSATGWELGYSFEFTKVADFKPLAYGNDINSFLLLSPASF